MEQYMKICPKICKGFGCFSYIDKTETKNEIKFVLLSVNGLDKVHALPFCYVAEDILFCKDEKVREEIFDLMYEWLLEKPKYEKGDFRWYFYSSDSASSLEMKDEFVDVSVLLRSYPRSLTERINRTLINLSRNFSTYGEMFDFRYSDHRLLFLGEQGENAISFFNILKDFDYLKIENGKYRITAEGWKQIEKIKRDSENSTDVFIAMSFGEETKEIRESFKSAIKECGYVPVIIDEVHHNNQIVPKILYHIKKSKFVVVDVTVPNHGAYYEAGYGQALNKEVIICCRKDVLRSQSRKKRPHFDISQKSMVVWDTHEELVERLIKRIEATVGRR